MSSVDDTTHQELGNDRSFGVVVVGGGPAGVVAALRAGPAAPRPPADEAQVEAHRPVEGRQGALEVTLPGEGLAEGRPPRGPSSRAATG